MTNSPENDLAALWGSPEKPQDHQNIDKIDEETRRREAELTRSGVKFPDDDAQPWVIIVDEMTTRQAWQIGPILGAHGVHGVFKAGPMAQQLADLWCHPKPKDPKARYKRKKEQ